MSQAEGSKLKLMVVDDEPDNLDLLYRTFRRDFRVYKADSGLNALQVLEAEGEMAVIISDQRMPQMNGTEFLSKTVNSFPDTIRILLTGYTDVEDLVDAINSGQVFKYITKPWNPENLKSVVSQAGDTYRVLKQRTNELSRALRREELFNTVTSAIRESLDYDSMLQRIVNTIGQTFEASSCILRPVESDRLTPESFSYQAPGTELIQDSLDNTALQTAIETRKTQLREAEEQGKHFTNLVVPLIYQQQLLVVLCLYQEEGDRHWSPQDVQLIEGVAEQAALAISQAKLYQRTQELAQTMRAELEVARQIQNNLLRQTMPEVDGSRVQACCYPARQVGGDFFEVYVHPQGDLWLAVGDVSGKGVPAALFMASAISVLRRELAQEVSPDPAVVMQNLNSIMLDDLVSNNCFITMVLARYTPTTGELVFANAGHIYPLVWSHQLLDRQRAASRDSVTVEPNFLKTRGVPLGILAVWKGKSGSVSLNSGETLLLTSDGITEANVNLPASSSADPKGNEQPTSSMLNQAGLWELLLQEPMPLDLTNLLSRIREHTEVQEDDQTILSLEVL
ncbi:SpoIIE family protein phosphatase [Microcoleus sp. FACHB-831]|uniref:SpoIIE family protein phosphatase n=1 Tax=Microcoleus sp. FACHB-831 TaxID=2692827 RepID=UPI001688D829|nr:SpoIIE family protein phosphatase [Microcoleus sp. FACHB-831]MBD1921373.1 SpoIIE family protein phosphatase [Microcoleus sp. FACHB-831]